MCFFVFFPQTLTDMYVPVFTVINSYFSKSNMVCNPYKFKDMRKSLIPVLSNTTPNLESVQFIYEMSEYPAGTFGLLLLMPAFGFRWVRQPG